MTEEKTTQAENKDSAKTAPIQEESRDVLSDKEQLEQMKKEEQLRRKISADLGELSALFEDIQLEAIPEQVWKRVKNGDSLTGAYSFYILSKAKTAEKAQQANLKNSQSAPPDIRSGKSADDYFSPDAVRNMSEKDVRANYEAILKSMEKWK